MLRNDPTGSAPQLVDLRRRIGGRLREARKERGWNQQRLGEAIDSNRFAIMRWERGEQDLRVDHARRIEEVLGVTGLVDLVGERDTLVDRVSGPTLSRDLVVDRMLRRPGITRVRTVLADDLDVVGMISRASLASAEIHVIVPTVKQEMVVFDGRRPVYGHIEDQLKRLHDLADARPPDGPRITLCESPAASACVVETRTASETEVATWPALVLGGARVASGDLPVATSTDQAVTDLVASHIEAVSDGARRIVKNEAFGIVRSDAVPDDADSTTFTRFGKASLGGGLPSAATASEEGVFVALTILHTVCPRRGHPLARRVVVYRRPEVSVDERKLSLASSPVDYLDVRRAREAEDPERADDAEFDLSRPSLDPDDAASDIDEYLFANGGSLPERVFQEAAARGLFAHYGLIVDPRRLRPLPLPPSLRFVGKEGGQSPILPRLFSLELRKQAFGREASELRVIEERVGAEVVGYEDFLDHEDLNDFLLRALRTPVPGHDQDPSSFLEHTLRELGIAPR